jgi:hypothetical protein
MNPDILFWIATLLGIALGKVLDAIGTFQRVSFQMVKLMDGAGVDHQFRPIDFQNVITPPLLTNLAIITFLGSPLLLIYAFFEVGFTMALIHLAVIVASVFAAKKILPPRIGSEIYVNWAHSTLLNRHANYLRDGDIVRASVLQAAISLIEAAKFSYFH